MINKMLLWVRRNSKKAIALAVAPGAAALGADAGMAHFFGTENDKLLQWVPVFYGPIAVLLVTIAVLPKSRAVFTWLLRITGLAGVAVGLAGAAFHFFALQAEMKGDYSWANFQGSINLAPPLFAPLGFAAIGALLMVLPSSKLFLRLGVGKPQLASTSAGPGQNVVPISSDERPKATG